MGQCIFVGQGIEMTAGSLVQELGMRQIIALGERNLAFERTGDPQGTPVFLLHGTPGSASGPKPRSIALHRLGVQLISYDRPGFGASDRQEHRSVRDAAHDVAAIADHLGLERFAVVGRSGGGPHALACAAVLPERVTRLAALVSLAPPDAPDLDWYSGMNSGNVDEYESADRDQRALLDTLDSWVKPSHSAARDLLNSLLPQLSDSDRRVIGDVALRRLLLTTYADGLRLGATGWIDDVLAFRKPWGIDLGAIAAPVLFWHGQDDQFSPVEHSRWLAANVPGSRLVIQPRSGHFGAVEVLPDILNWLTGDGDTQLSPATLWPEAAGEVQPWNVVELSSAGSLRRARADQSRDTPATPRVAP
jgi:pimeloyl-ACP methyl ester carboxylesterase